jgi:hypothetical protein
VALAWSLVVVAGCGGHADERADLEGSTLPTTPPATMATSPPQSTQVDEGSSSLAPASAVSVSGRERADLTTRAADIGAAIGRWDDRFGSCIGPSGDGDDAGATCTRSAWEQLFKQMYVAHSELLAIVDRIHAGRCHEEVAAVVDAVHGFLSGATPTNVVWLDEQQRPPSRFDLESVVDIVRPVPARIRDAVAAACA